MLVLSRHLGESIVIDHNIVVTIVMIKDNKVRLGIEAPKEISVNRSEIEYIINSSTNGNTSLPEGT